MDWYDDEFRMTDDPHRIDLEAVSRLLGQTSWAAARNPQQIRGTLEHSLCFSLWHLGTQVGFARLITDQWINTLLCDLIIDAPYRHRGLGRWMMRCILEHPRICRSRVMLLTHDAQEFYKTLGFGPHPYSCLIKPGL